MKRRIITALLLITSFVHTGCSLQTVQSRSDTVQIHAKELTKDAGTGINLDYSRQSMDPVWKFAYQLLAYNMEETNPVFSPVSAYIALSMAGNGAEGKTKQEFSNVLGADMMCIPDTLMKTLPQKDENLKLTMANSAWIDESFTAKKEWLGTMRSLFDARVYQADLDTKKTMKDINVWVSKNTNKMIPGLLNQPLKSSTKLALINTVYFRADWMQQFDAQSTSDGIFHMDDGTQNEASMMHALHEGCDYLKDDTAEGVILPYKNSRYAFAAVKPLGKESIREWLEAYSYKKLNRLIKKAKKEDVSLGLVKFTAKSKKELNDSLKEMGIRQAFDAGKADFSSLGKTKDGQNLYISLVLQEAVIKTGEKGTEAAAATIVEADAGGAMQMHTFLPVTFDRPFLYMILDMDNHVPVFIGIMEKP